MSNKQLFVVVPQHNHGVSMQPPIVADTPELAAKIAAETYDLPRGVRDLSMWETYVSAQQYWDWTDRRSGDRYHIHGLEVQADE